MNNSNNEHWRENQSIPKEPAEFRWKQFIWLVILLLHVALALAMNASRLVSTAHAIITLAAGIFIVLSARNARRIAWVTAYISGAEILWRMTESAVFWEYAKYAIVLLMVLALLRMKKVQNAALPVFYFVPLLFSIPLTLFNLPFNHAREAISSNLSGPLSLAMSVMFFYQVNLSWKEREITSWYLVSPVIGIAALCVRSILTAEELMFTSNANFITSAGYGPNQVSAILGLGALLLLLISLKQSSNLKRWFPMLTAYGLVALSALTFSRGGLYNLAASIVILGVFSLRSSRMRRVLIPAIMISLLIGAFVFYPRLNDFTEGMLKVRFSDTSLTGRDRIMQAEFAAWMDHPLLGVGPGLEEKYVIDFFGRPVAPHTEYTRVLASHGFFGLISLFALAMICLKTVLRAPKNLAQGWSAALITWSVMEMMHAAMRISAIGFVIGLAAAGWATEENNTPTTKNELAPHR